MAKLKLTSVKVDEISWNDFKKLSIDEFVNNKSFRKTIKKKVTSNEKEKNTTTIR